MPFLFFFSRLAIWYYKILRVKCFNLFFVSLLWIIYEGNFTLMLTPLVVIRKTWYHTQYIPADTRLTPSIQYEGERRSLVLERSNWPGRAGREAVPIAVLQPRLITRLTRPSSETQQSTFTPNSASYYWVETTDYWLLRSEFWVLTLDLQLRPDLAGNCSW